MKTNLAIVALAFVCVSTQAQGVRISELPAKTSVTDAAIFPVVVDGSTWTVSVGNLFAGAGRNTLNIATVNAGAVVSANVVSSAITANNTTASTLVMANSAKLLTSVPNGQGVLTNNGSGVFSYMTLAAAESNTGLNLGTGYGLFFNKVGSELRFKSVTNSPGLSITATSDLLTFALTGNLLNWLTLTTNEVARTASLLALSNRVETLFSAPIDELRIGALLITNVTPARALIMDASGYVTNSNVTTTELGRVSGVTSPIQTQLNTIQATANSGYTNATNALEVANTAYTNSIKALTVRLAAAPVTITFNATLPTDASLGCVFRSTLTGNFTLANPTNPVDGQRVVWELIQDGTGSRVMTLGAAFALGTDISAVTLTTTASKRDFLTAIYNSTAGKWYVTGFVKGY